MYPESVLNSCIESLQLELFKYLLSKSITLENFPLIHSIIQKCPEKFEDLVDLLLQKGFDINTVNSTRQSGIMILNSFSECSALCYALQTGKFEVVPLLLKRGINVDLISSDR